MEMPRLQTAAGSAVRDSVFAPVCSVQTPAALQHCSPRPGLTDTDITALIVTSIDPSPPRRFRAPGDLHPHLRHHVPAALPPAHRHGQGGALPGGSRGPGFPPPPRHGGDVLQPGTAASFQSARRKPLLD